MIGAERRMTSIGVLLAVPAVIAAVGLAALEGYRVLNPGAAIFGGPGPRSLAESITGGYDVEQTYVFIRQGQDPNAVFAFSHPDLTGDVAVRVSPLTLAIAARDSSAVRMLFTFGARLDVPANQGALCLAREIRNEEIVGILEGESRGRRTDCPARRADAPTPLVAWAGGDPG